MSQNKQYIEQHKIHRTQKIHRTTQKLGRLRAVPRFCGFYPGICLTAEKKAWKTLNHGSENLSQGTTFILFYKMWIRRDYMFRPSL